MTTEHHSSELDSESDDGNALSRVTVLVGGEAVDVGLPSRVNISEFVIDVVKLAIDQLAQRSASVTFDSADDGWTFAHLTGKVIDPERSLAEAGVSDGELLILHRQETPSSSVLVDEFDDVDERDSSVRPQWLPADANTAGWFALAAASATAFVSPELAVRPAIAEVPIVAILMLVAGFGCAVAGWLLANRADRLRGSTWLVGVALPLIFGGSLYIVPHASTAAALLIAMASTGLVASLQLLFFGHSRTIFTAVAAVTAYGAPAALAQVLFEPNPRTVGVICATLAVAGIYLAPRVTIGLCRLPIPRVPTAGEPLDDIETMGGTAVEGVSAVGKQVIPTEEGMAERVRRASEYLTGIIAAAAIVAVAGCYLTVDVSAGFYWQGTAFAVVVATVMCLRGRSHHDLIQSAVLIGGSMSIALLMIVKTAVGVDGWQLNAALALVALLALSLVCGLVAPRIEFSPIMRRWVEILEYVAVGLVLPLACAIVGLYAHFRGLQF